MRAQGRGRRRVAVASRRRRRTTHGRLARASALRDAIARRAAMAKGATKAGAILVKLVSAARTGFFYVKRKNPKKTPRKLEFVKYDPRVRRRRDGVATRTREPCSAVTDDDAAKRGTSRARRFDGTCCSRRRRLTSERRRAKASAPSDDDDDANGIRRERARVDDATASACMNN